jgi:hypothetical protein
MFRTSLCAIALLATAAPASAWTYREFTAGATIDEVGAALSAKRGSLERVSGVAASSATEVFVVQPASVPVLTFCHGHLSGYSDRIPGDIKGFLDRAAVESATRSTAAMPQFRLDIGRRNSFELTEAQWALAPGVQLTLSWSAAGGTGIGLETVTQECPETPPPAVAEAAPPAVVPASPESESPAVVAQAPEPAAPAPVAAAEQPTATAEAVPVPAPSPAPDAGDAPAARTAEAAPPVPGTEPVSPSETLAGTLHTPGVDTPADDAPETSGQAASTGSGPAEPAASPGPGASAVAEPPRPEQPPAAVADGNAPAGEAAATALAAVPASPVPPASPAPAAPVSPDVAVVVPLPPEAPVVIADAARPSEPAPAPREPQAVVVPPPPEVPAPFQTASVPQGPATAVDEAEAFPRPASVPLPPPRPAELLARIPPPAAEPAAQQRPARRLPADATGVGAAPSELPQVIVPGSQPEAEAAPAATGEFPRPPADVGSTAAVSPDGGQDGSGPEAAPAFGDPVQSEMQSSVQPAPATTGSTASGGRRWPPATPEACAAAFRSYDPGTRTYRSHSGAVRPCP